MESTFSSDSPWTTPTVIVVENDPYEGVHSPACQRGFGASDKPRDLAASADSAMARDVIALIELRVEVPVLVLNGKADVANQKVGGLLKAIPTSSAAECEGDHHSTPYEPTFQRTVIRSLEEQWRSRQMALEAPCPTLVTRPCPSPKSHPLQK